ncbi:MAG TPA: hypothetical protein VKS03_01765, partial [Thermoanaerobaculia bacterium]|nr:hypothetical protein [Thermoanaerobaculia bacterium]
LAIAALGLVPRSGKTAGDTFVASFGISMRLSALLAVAASLCAVALIRNPRRERSASRRP